MFLTIHALSHSIILLKVTGSTAVNANTENLYFGVSRNVKLINVVAELVALHCKSDELYWEHSVLQ